MCSYLQPCFHFNLSWIWVCANFTNSALCVACTKKKKNERKRLASDCGDEGKNEDDDHTHTKSCFFGTHHNEAHSNCGLRVSMCCCFFVFDILHITVIVAGCDVRRISRCVELIIYGIGFIPLVIRVTVCRRGRIHCQWPAGWRMVRDGRDHLPLTWVMIYHSIYFQRS